MTFKKIFSILTVACCAQLTGQVLGPPRTTGQAPNYSAVLAQATPGSGPSQTAPPTLTLQDAIKLSESNFPQYISAISDASVAHEDVLQSRSAVRPTVGFKSDYLGTQGNGHLASG